MESMHIEEDLIPRDAMLERGITCAMALCLFFRPSVRHKSTAEFVIKQIALRLQFTTSSTMSVH